MTLLKLNQKIERLTKQMYKAVEQHDFDKADKLRKKIVDLDAQALKIELERGF